MLAYAPRHGEQKIPHGSVRRRMALYRPAPARPHRRTRTPQGSRLKGDPRCRLLCAQKRLPLAVAAEGLRTPWKTVYDWFRRWRIDGTWERLNTELRERLRCRIGRDPNPSAGIVDSQSVRTTGVGGNERGFDPAKKVEGRKRHLNLWTPKDWCSKLSYTAPKSSRRRWHQAAVGPCAWSPLWPIAPVGRCRLPGEGKEVGRGGDGLERRGSAQAQKAAPRGGGQGLGTRMGKGRHRGGLAEVDAGEGFSGLAEKVGGGAYHCVDLPQQEDGQRLREIVRNRGGLCLRGDDAADGEAIGPCVGVSRQSLEGEF
jgi:transposase